MSEPSAPIYVQIANRILLHHDEAGTNRPRPSVRRVAREFGVSSVTASRALQLVRERTLRLDDGEKDLAAEHWAVCLHVSPGPHQHAAAQLTEDGFRALARERQTVFEYDNVQLANRSAREIESQVGAAAERGVQGIFLLPSRTDIESLRRDEALLAACQRQQLPVVLIERNLRGEDRPLEQDLVSFHDFEGGRLLAGHLLGLGRRRIAFLTGSPTSSHTERLGGYLSALNSAGIETSLVTTQSPNLSVGDAYRDLAERLLEWQADSVICYHEYAAVGLVMELLRRGKSIPNDVAVAAFYSLGLGESFSIGITAYSFPAKTVAARALDVMRWRVKSADAPPVRVVVPGELIVRNSTVSDA